MPLTVPARYLIMAKIAFPPLADVINFIYFTHHVDHLSEECPHDQITPTYQGTQKPPNPYARGHINAISYIFNNLAGNADFPVKDSRILSSVFKSEINLYWLKDLHSIMLSPLLDDIRVKILPDCPTRGEIGSYRVIDTMNSFSPAPPPPQIPRCLHVWLKKISELNENVRDRLDNPFGLKKEEADQLERAAYESSLLISTVQPFKSGNNRLGRLVENTLRLHWRMNIKIPTQPVYARFIRDITDYQQNELPKLVKEAKELHGV